MNLFELPAGIHREEIADILWQTEALRVERIVSWGQVSPEGFWYDQEEDEWVSVLEGTKTRLGRGDALFLPAHVRHRVSFTSKEPPCVWLCVFGKTVPESD